MPENNLYQDAKAFASSMIRALAVRRAGSDAEKLREIGALSDDETLRKWLWTAAVIGAPACFIAVPILLCCLNVLFSNFFMAILWFMDKVAMAVVIFIFAFAVYLTWRKESN